MNNKELQPYEIDVSNLDKVDMIKALYDFAYNALGQKPTIEREAVEEFVNGLTKGEDGHRLYIDYFQGKCMKIHFGRPILDTRLYNRDNGNGAAQEALKDLLK